LCTIALISVSVNGCRFCLGATITRTSGQGFSTTNFFFTPHTQQAFIKTIRSRTVTGSSFSASKSLNFSAKLSETEIVFLLLKNTETCFCNARYLFKPPIEMDRRLYSTNWSKRSETEIDSFFCGLYLTGEGSKLPLAMSSSIVRALISAALRLAIVSGKPMYSPKLLPCYDRASGSRSWKTSILPPLWAYRRFIALSLWDCQ